MYNLGLKDSKEYFNKSIVQYICNNKDWTLQHIRWNKYVQTYGYSNKIELLYSELLEKFLFNYKDYREDYDSEYIDSLCKYVKYLIKLGLKTYILADLEYNKNSVPLEQGIDGGIRDYLNCKELGVDLYSSPSGISVNEDVLRETIRDLYVLGLKQQEDYMLVVYMLYHTNVTSLIDYYALQGINVTTGNIKELLRTRSEILEILAGLEQVNDNTMLNIIRDRVQDIELVDNFIGTILSDF